MWRDESQVPRSTLTRVDALSESSAWLDPVAGAVLNARYLRAALAAGEPHRVVRALLAEAIYQGVIGTSTEKQVDRALAAAAVIVDRLGDARLRALQASTLAVVTYQRGHLAAAVPLFDAAVKELQALSTGSFHFELSVLQVFRLFSLSWLGRYTDLKDRYREVLRDADERGDLWGGKVELLFGLRRAEYRTYIPAPDQRGQRCFTDKGGMLAREAFHHNRARVGRAKGKRLLRLRGERIERTFAHACETGAHRRVRLRGRENARKRYLAHIAALNLGLVMRALTGYGTPREMAAAIAAGWIALLHFALGSFVRVRDRLLGTALPRAGGDPVGIQLAA